MIILESRHKGSKCIFLEMYLNILAKDLLIYFLGTGISRTGAGRWTSISDSVIISSKVAEPYSPK